MTPEEIKAIQNENIALKQQVNDLGVEKSRLISDLGERDTKISTLEANAKERGQQFKRFKDMTDAEKDLLSEKEQELLQRQDQLELDRQKDIEDRKAYDKKIKDTTINNLAFRLAKGDKDLSEQIKINLGKLNAELLEKAQTEEELTPYVQDAFNMTGVNSRQDSLREAHNTYGAPAEIKANDFAETKEGQALGQALGLESFNSNQ